MVTVHRALGFRFTIYKNDHEPAHIHVVGNGGEAKVQLSGPGGLALIWTVGISHPDLRRIMREVEVELTRLVLKWQEIHG